MVIAQVRASSVKVLAAGELASAVMTSTTRWVGGDFIVDTEWPYPYYPSDYFELTLNIRRNGDQGRRVGAGFDGGHRASCGD
ncbi:hypothetical protein MASB_32570 [Mycobacteroides abscessus subsp. bolletii BD]|nr:hypothetical protein MASB_32570 [Mycobacteroides abscessus subsp. bolletii BD]